jgi:hypothetical protein
MFKQFQTFTQLTKVLSIYILLGRILYAISSESDVDISVALIVLIWLITVQQFNSRTIDFYYPTARKPDSLIMYLLSYQRLVLHFIANALKYVCIVYIIYCLLQSFYEHRYEQTAKAIPAALHIFFGPIFLILCFVFIIWYYSFISGQLDKEENVNLIEVSKYPVINWLIFFILLVCLTIYPSIVVDKYILSKIANPDEHFYYKLSQKILKVLSHNNLFQSIHDFKPFAIVFGVGLVAIILWAMVLGLAEGQKIKSKQQVR